MAQSPRRQPPACYQLRVDGHLDHHWSAWFDDLTLTHESDGTTSLSGLVSDRPPGMETVRPMPSPKISAGGTPDSG